MISVASRESDGLLAELFETSAWNEAVKRTRDYVADKRTSIFNGSLADAEIVLRVREITAIRRLFENLYLTSGEMMPAELRKVFE